MSKPYTWEEIKGILSTLLKSSKHVMTFGTIGSCNIEHDIDMIITKKPQSKTSDFYRELHSIFDYIDNYLLKRYNCSLQCISVFYQPFAKYSNSVNKNDLIFDVMSYISYPEIRKDWGWAISEDENVDEILDSQSFLKGKLDDLHSIQFGQGGKFDNLHIFLYSKDVSNSRLPDKYKIVILNEVLDYIINKRLGLKAFNIVYSKDFRRYYYKACDIIDKVNVKI